MRAISHQAQHIDLWRKVELRRRLCSDALPGAVYLPFCGDGDIAVELYNDRPIYAADLDPERVKTAQGRLRDAVVRIADCDDWPFPDIREPFAVADLDAYSNPYKALAAFWGAATKAERIVVFGTDGLRLNFRRVNCTLELPSGYRTAASLAVSREQNNFWWLRYVLPYLTGLVQPGRIVRSMKYLRNGMVYWGIVVDLG